MKNGFKEEMEEMDEVINLENWAVWVTKDGWIQPMKVIVDLVVSKAIVLQSLIV